MFTILMTAFPVGSTPRFRPQFLGDKWPYVDFFVELLGADDFTPYFFAQVKTTRQGYTVRQNRLKVRVSEEQIHGLIAYPAPTYIVGIDEVQEQGYIVSANGENPGSLSSLSTVHRINGNVRDRLWQEVHDFWRGYDRSGFSSSFSDSDWR